MKFYLRVIRATAGHSESKERLRTVRLPCHCVQCLQCLHPRSAERVLHT